MEMETFWSTVPQADHLSHKQVQSDYPEAYAAAKEEFLDFDYSKIEFAFSVIPNCGPGGPTTDADEAAMDAAGIDDCQSDGPSLGGDMVLMFYNHGTDELFHFAEDGGWICWNY